MSDLFLRMKSEAHSFSKAQRKVYEYLICSPEAFLQQSAIEIGKSSGASSATVIRFIQQLGFGSLEEAKVNIARNTASQAEEPLDPVISTGDSLDEIANKLTQLVEGSIRLAKYQLDLSSLSAALDCLKKAEMIYLLGIGTSGVIARDLYGKLSRANIRCMYQSDPHSALANSVYLTERDAVLAISYSGRTREILATARQAKKRKASVIALTREDDSPLVQAADIVLQAPRNESLLRIGTIASKYSTMWIADLLFLGLVNENYDAIEEGILQSAQAVLVLKE